MRRLEPFWRGANWLLAAYCGVVFTMLFWPLSGWGLVIVGLLAWRTRAGPRHTELGSAKWADESDLKNAGLLGASRGLVLGRLPRSRGGLFGRRSVARPSDPIVRLPDAVHSAVFAPTGTGKGTSIVLPTLLTNEESCVVLDFKGELAKQTAVYRRKRFGHRVVLLDPYRTVTRTPDSLNVFDAISAGDALALDDCNDVAASLVVRTGMERERHWDDSAESCIAAVAATVVTYGEPGTRSLAQVREILSHPKSFEMAVQLMTESDAWDGALARLGGNLLHLEGKEKSSVLSSALRHLKFLGTPAIAASTATSTFDPAELRRGKMTVFCILPPDRAAAQTGLLRLWTSSLLRACIRGGLQ